MKYLTISAEKYVMLFSVVLLVLIVQVSATAQCSLSCNGATQVSLSESCNDEITASMILSDGGASCPDAGGVFNVTVSDEYGVIDSVNVVSMDYMGQTLTVMVEDPTTGNTCWGDLIVEDKLGPTITCPDLSTSEIGSSPMNAIPMSCLDMEQYPGPAFVDNCSADMSAILISESVATPDPCNNEIVKTIQRVYTAQDNQGNVAPNTCTIFIELTRINPTRIVFPDSLILSKSNALTCVEASAYDANGNGKIDHNETIDPNFTGIPYYSTGEGSNLDLYPYPNIFCNTVVSFEDIVLPKIGCTQKIMRRWKINDWLCDGEEREIDTVQLIEIVDEVGPDIEKLGNNCLINGQTSVSLSTNTLISAPGSGDTYGDFNCGATVSIPLPKATNNCPSGLNYDLFYNTGFKNGYDGSEPIVLPMGTTTIQFTVYDDCYNSSTCHMAVNIVDDTPPIAICDQNTTVSVTSAGIADIRASSFDDGSYDDCKLHCALVRRMDAGSCDCRVPEICDLEYFGKFGDSYYYVSNYDATSTIASKRALAYGGSLVTAGSEEKEAWINENLRSEYSGSVWVGSLSNSCSILNTDDVIEHVDCSAGPLVAPLEYRYVLELPATDCGFSSSVSFCCDDASATNENGDPLAHMVVYRVVDFYGNFNDCMVNAYVQNKAIPVLNCPPNQTIECDHIYDANNLDLEFGYMTEGESCGSFIVQTLEDDEDDKDECGFGTFTRRWTAYTSAEPTANELTHCKQVISIVNSNPFNVEEDVECPVQDINITGCNNPGDFGPEVLGTPTYTAGPCDIIGTDYDDQLFVFNNNNAEACFKILRNWKIIDWCTNNTKTCVQVIKVLSDSRPLVTDLKREDICTYEPNCDGGLVELQAQGEDACTAPENLTWTYRIENASGQNVQNGSGTGALASLSHFLDLGEYQVSWTFFNGCGSATTETQIITLSNCKSATAYCINGLAVDLMPIDSNNDGVNDDGMIELWAKDFDAGSSHPCGYDVHLSFSSDVTETNKTFGCTSVVNGIEVSGVGNQLVEIWATVYDLAGNEHQTYCSTYVDIQDNMGSCVNFRTVNLEGNVATEQEQTVENVEVSLKGSPMATITNTDGAYAFPSMPTGGNYTVDPYSNVEPLQGISTLDLIMIQRHILGIEALDSPYKAIAADIDNTNSINGIDLVELRKLILGIYDEFPQNDSWKFVDKSYAFTNVLDPLNEAYVEDYQISNLNSNMAIDFVAIKVGDVNNSVDELIRTNQSNRLVSNTTNIEIGIPKSVATNGTIVNVPVSFDANSSISGFQFNLGYNADQIDVLEVKGINIDINENNYFINDGSIFMSWNNNVPVNDISFEVVITVKRNDVKMSDLFIINSEGIDAEVYSDNLKVSLPVIKGSANNIFRLEQNSPNPFSSVTDIKVMLEKDEQVKFAISDLQGRLINAFNRDLTQGVNVISINKDDLGEPGIYYLNVTTTQNKETIKMVLID